MKNKSIFKHWYVFVPVIWFFSILLAVSDTEKPESETFGEKVEAYDEKSDTETVIQKVEVYDEKSERNYKLKFGELLDVVVQESSNTLIIKAKINPSMTNKQTVQQNYHSVEDLIRNQGANVYDEIQYWAVADMTDGSESKVINFTLDKGTIDAVANEQIHAIELQDYVSDLWILPSLNQ